MTIVVNIIIGIVALLHIYFLVLEMFLWEKPAGRKSFHTTAEFAAQSKTLAANQGLYNGFLAAGLIWELFADDSVKDILPELCHHRRHVRRIHGQQADILYSSFTGVDRTGSAFSDLNPSCWCNKLASDFDQLTNYREDNALRRSLIRSHRSSNRIVPITEMAFPCLHPAIS